MEEGAKLSCQPCSLRRASAAASHASPLPPGPHRLHPPAWAAPRPLQRCLGMSRPRAKRVFPAAELGIFGRLSSRVAAAAAMHR